MSIAKLEHEITVPTGTPDGSRRLRVVHDRQEVNLPAAERAVRDLLLALGRDARAPHLADTPRRVATSLTEMLTPREFDLTTSPTPRTMTSWCWPRASRCSPCASTTCCRSPGSLTSATCRANAFSAYPSWPAS